jgi:hypothetical protein
MFDEHRKAQPAIADALHAIDAKAAALEGNAPRGPNAAPAQGDLSQLHSRLSTLLEVLQQSDDAPTAQAVAASADFQKQLRELMSRWQQLKGEVESIKAKLREGALPPLTN